MRFPAASVELSIGGFWYSFVTRSLQVHRIKVVAVFFCRFFVANSGQNPLQLEACQAVQLLEPVPQFCSAAQISLLLEVRADTFIGTFKGC